MSTFQDLLAHLALEHDREVNSATSTLRKLQRQVAVLRARLSELNSTENHPSDGAESGVTGSGDDELGGGEFESRPGRACEQSLEDKTPAYITPERAFTSFKFTPKFTPEFTQKFTPQQ